MPRVANRRSALAGARRHRRVGRKVRTVARRVPRSLGRLGRMSDIHHFKGIINAGIIQLLTLDVSTNDTGNAGVFVLRLLDIPNYPELSSLYEFIRVNRCTLEFMPRYNQTNIPIGTDPTMQTAFRLPTFVTGLDEVPLVSAANLDIQIASSWTSQGGDSSGIREMTAYQCSTAIGADYIRGLKGSKETEIYKKHRVSFIPTFYDYAMTNQLVATGPVNVPAPNSGIFEQKKKKWLNCSYLKQNGAVGSTVTSTIVSSGPDMFGPVYAFSNVTNATGASNKFLELYDVKLHYSISLKRYKGQSGGS